MSALSVGWCGVVDVELAESGWIRWTKVEGKREGIAVLRAEEEAALIGGRN